MNLLILIAALLLSGLVQTTGQLSSVVGTVTAVEKTTKTVSIKTDQNAALTIKASDTTAYLRVPAGAQSLEQAAPISFDEIAIGIGCWLAEQKTKANSPL